MRNNRICSALLLAIAALVPTLARAASAGPATHPASTQPITAGRDTPAGAMMAYEHAIETGDVATVVDSVNIPPDTIWAGAQAMVIQAQFIRALNEHFGHDNAAMFCQDCNLHPQQTGTKYTNDEWTIRPEAPDEADSKPGSRAPYLYRGADGIWRMGAIYKARSRHGAATAATDGRDHAATAARLHRTQNDAVASRMQQLIPKIEGGKYATIEDVEHALYPQGTPMARMRQMEQQQKQAQEQAQKQQEQAILAYHFDPSTLEGSIGLYVQAIMRRDPAGMAKLMFVPGAADNSYPTASANRLLAIEDFDQAMDKLDPKGSGLAGSFGLENDAAFTPSLAWDQPQQHGDIGMITRGGEGHVAAWYRKVDGVWKQEIKLQVHPPQTLASYTKDMEDDTAALQRIAADINSGKLTTVDQVRDALGNAGLNSFSDPTFTIDMEHNFQNQPKGHDRPEHAPAPTAPTTPAGAMNRFIRAVQSGDETTVRDSLWLPNDHNGAAAAAMAHDYVVGVRFARALQKDSPGWDPNYFCHNCGVIQPDSLRDYSEDEWITGPSHPDIAVSNDAFIAKPDLPGASTRPSFTMLHEWTPMMHRGTDGVWRLGPWYPQSAHQLRKQTAMLAAKDQILRKATADLNANKVRTIDDLANSMMPQLQAIGATPVTTMQP